jgi:RND family efflux transporter MFP subunit
MKGIPQYYLCLLALPLLQACGEPPPESPQVSEPAAVGVLTLRVEPGSWLHTFKSYGLVTPAEEYDISVEVGSTVKTVLFRAGEAVRVGDVLLTLDDKKLRFQRDGARATVEEARANFEQASSTHERNRSIYTTGVISEQNFLQSESRLKSSKANLSRAMSAYDIATEELADAEVKSPVNGVVTQRDIEPGKNVTPADKLGVIRVMDALRVETFVSQKDINHVHVGMIAAVTSPGVPGQIFSGRVDQVASSAEAATGNFEIGVVVDDGGGLLRDGMSAMVEFTGAPQQDILAIPRNALVDRGRRLIVYKILDNVTQAVEPVLGVGNSERVPVFAGLDSGDEIVISNLRLISDGQVIKRSNGGPKTESRPAR